MSLPKPNLDNKTFDKLVEEAEKIIPGYSPEWTDYNLSDPGITLIDLFAWLSEIALYRANLVTDSHRLKYLQLLGVKPQPPKQAKVDLTFSPDENKVFCKKFIHKGTQVSTEIAGNPVHFLLDDDINVIPGKLEKTVVYDVTSGVFDRSISNNKGDLFFAPFGEDVQKGSALYLGFSFDNYSSGTENLKKRMRFSDCNFNYDNNHPDTLNFMCYLYEKDLIEPGKHGNEEDFKFENSSLKWDFSINSSGNISDEAAWKTILPDEIEDKTEGFKKSGRFVFKQLEDWTLCNPFPELIKPSESSESSKCYFWIRCKVEESQYEYPPRIVMLVLNTVSATHGLTVSDDDEKRVSNGLPGQVFKLKETPVIDKTLKLSINEWNEVQDLEKSGSYDKHFVLSRKTDYKPQSLKTANRKMAFKSGQRRQMCKFCQKYSITHRHYLTTGVIKFGDGKKGLIPPMGSIITMLKYDSKGVEKGKLIGYSEWVSNGSKDQIFEVENLPTPKMTFKLSVEKEKWVEVHDFENSRPYSKHFILNREAGIVRFGNGKKGLVPSKDSLVVILECANEGGEKIKLIEEWVSNGLPDQFFQLKEYPIPEMKYKLLVEEKWSEVDDFEGSGPSDKHYILDNEKGEIRFGDGLMGSVPSEGSIIEILEYVSGGGEEGNLMPESSWYIVKSENIQSSKNLGLPTSYLENSECKIINCRASIGGKKAQTIEEAIKDFRRDLKVPYTAVTLSDFEQIAINTPGLRVATAKAIPNCSPSSNLKTKNLDENIGSVTVVIIPYTPLEFFKDPPEPSEEFKNAVCQHLDKHRLLGTEIHVISPAYVEVIVCASIVPMDSYHNDNLILNKVLEKLNKFLHPITGGLDQKGWPIGRYVYLSELYSMIENIDGVNCVIRLSISGDKFASLDPDGNLKLNPIASVYSGIHRVDIIRNTNLYYKRGDSYSGS